MSIMRCVEAFAYSEANGVERVLTPGCLVESDDPAVKRAPQYFEPAELNAAQSTERAIEQATAAPSEKRPRTRKKA